MFGRFKEHEDEPDWREKLADWRDSPPVILERPGWLGESPLALGLLFAGIAFVLAAAVYVAVAPEALPATLPGRCVAPVTTTHPTTTTTTSTTIPLRKTQLALLQASKLTPTEKAKYWGWIQATRQFAEEEIEIERIVAEPAKPPTRRFDLALIALVVGGLCLGGAWAASDSRQRFAG